MKQIKKCLDKLNLVQVDFSSDHPRLQKTCCKVCNPNSAHRRKRLKRSHSDPDLSTWCSTADNSLNFCTCLRKEDRVISEELQLLQLDEKEQRDQLVSEGSS